METEKGIKAFMLFAVVVNAVWIVIVVSLIYKGCTYLANQDYSDGMKPFIEKAWCGNKGCLGGKK